MTIGDLLLRILADDSGFEADVVKKADKAGAAGEKTLGARLGGALKSEGVRLFGVATTAAFGLMTGGAARLEDAMARFRAETGATADEAERAGRVINKVAGDERMSLEAVTDIAIRVKRDLGAVGDEADGLTARIAKFARVTRQDGAGAVSDIDDVVDAWSLTLKDIPSLLDKLVVSGQKWGGSITDDQKALAAMAPQLKAFHLTVDDGIALLNLFKASGLDAAGIPRALNSAIKKLDGRPLTAFIAELAAIEDPGERARRAIEVFGSRAGAQLANAIKPGMDSLDAFKISSEEAGGAVDKAGDIIDNTFTGRVKKALSQAAAGLREFGLDLGSATTALATLASLGVTVGGGKLLRGLANITLRPLAGLGVRIATFIAAEVAGSTAIQALGTQLAAGFAKLPGLSTVKSAIAKAGTALGTPLGKAIGLTTAIVFVAWFVDELNKQRERVAVQAKSIGDSVGEQIATGTTAQLEQTRAALKRGIDQIVADTKRGPIQMATPQQIDALKLLVEQYNLVQAELGRRAELNARILENELLAARDGTAQAAGQMADELPTALEKRQAIVRAAAEEWARKPIGEQLVLLGHEVRQKAAEVALGLASSLRDGRSAVVAAFDQLGEDIKNALSPKQIIGKDVGMLIGRRLAHALESSNPLVKAQAEGTRALIEDELIETVRAGGAAGEAIQAELEEKLHSKDPAVRRQAERTKSLIDNALKEQPAKSPGEAIGEQLNSDLADEGTTLGRTAYTLGRTIARNLLAGVRGTGYVPAPTGTSGGTTAPKQGGALEFASGTWSVPGDQFAMVHNREIIVPAAPSDAIRSGEAVLGTASAISGGPLIGELKVDARGHDNPDAVGRAVRDAVGDAVADVLRDQSIRGPIGVRL